MAAAATSGIPRIIHQIWIGSNPRPDLWMDSVREFAAAHGYEYRLWTEKEAARLPWGQHKGLRALYDSFAKELAGRADLIRLLALYKHGGIYIDADTVILKPAKFAAFLEKNEAPAFFGWEELSESKRKKLGDLGEGLRGQRRLIANGTIGATAGNPFIGELLERVVENATGPEAGEGAWRRVGPLFVTRVWRELRPTAADVRIYPMRYFYPKDWHGIKDPELHKKARIPGESMLFQYGYSTNKFAEIFARRKRRTRRQRQGQQRD